MVAQVSTVAFQGIDIQTVDVQVQKGDLVIICAYASMDAKEAQSYEPVVVLLDEQNAPKNL